MQGGAAARERAAPILADSFDPESTGGGSAPCGQTLAARPLGAGSDPFDSTSRRSVMRQDDQADVESVSDELYGLPLDEFTPDPK